MKVQLIAARSKNQVIGNGPDIPWRAKGEQKLFRDITMGSTLIMGRKTFESIGKPLPGRETIIVTRDSVYRQAGCQTAMSVEAAIDKANEIGKPIFIAGGGEIYAQAMPMVQELHLTTIGVECEGDVFFPEFDADEFELIEEQQFETNLSYVYQHFVRKPLAE